MTKIYTTNIKKGGVGKTTITFNGAFYLAVKKNKRVLLIDLDDSCNLTKRFIDYYEEPIPEISTVKALFSDVVPVPLRLTDHLSIIAGYDHLNELTKEVEAGKGRGYLLSWYYSQLDFIEAMMKRDNQFLGYFEGRSLFGKTKTTRQPLTSLEETHQTPSYCQFFKNTWELFDKIFTLPIE